MKALNERLNIAQGDVSSELGSIECAVINNKAVDFVMLFSAIAYIADEEITNDEVGTVLDIVNNFSSDVIGFSGELTIWFDAVIDL
jgi:hypothetical protein